MAALNKRILCFIDESGTAGLDGFALGCVMVWTRDCGRLDRCFSNLLEPNAGEVHASRLHQDYLKGLLARLAQTEACHASIMLNRSSTRKVDAPSLLYAVEVIELVKIAIGLFRKLHMLKGPGLGNVELIMDRNHHNTVPEFLDHLEQARQSDGRFKAVCHIAQIDSAASRVLQLADVVAHSRMWITSGEENARGLREAFGIRVL